MRLRVEVVEFPATSVALTVMELAPCTSESLQTKPGPEITAGVPLQVMPDSPDNWSLPEPVTLMVVVLKLMVEPLAGDVIFRPGPVLSRLTVTEAVAELPATSVALPPTIWFAPSLVITCGGGQFAIPEVASLHVNVTVTGVLFQPAALGAGETAA